MYGTTHDDEFDFELFDCKANDSGETRVALVDDVGDVAMDKDIPRAHIEDCCFRDTGIAAADPEDFGLLFQGKFGEEGSAHTVGPIPIIAEDLVNVCGRHFVKDRV
jgi:hypothetical protein